MPSSKQNKKAQKLSSQQPPIEQPTQNTSKGKQPMRLPPEQPAQAKSTGKKPQQLPAQQSEQDDSKNTQPTRKPVRGMPRLWVARIPVKRNSRIKRVEVVVTPDTAYRHPQTFFFNNIPEVDRYWGWLNDAATTAQRMVRLELGGHPTPYFLLACRGEYPKIKLPRNENVIFANMQVSVFGDAFVFKLADPELNEHGYTRYCHIEDIGGIDWIPQAIREAARKVEYATASKANPGSPDITNYADQETITKDVHRMLRFMAAYRKAAKKEVPSSELVDGVLEKLLTLLLDWRKDFFSTVDVDPDPYLTLKAVFENVNRILSASTTTGSSKTKTGDGFESVDDSIKAMNDAFSKWVTKHGADGKWREFIACGKSWDSANDMLKCAISRNEASHAMLNSVILEFETYDAFDVLKAEIDRHELYSKRVRVAKEVDAAMKSDAAGTSEANQEMSDLSSESGTKRQNVELLE